MARRRHYTAAREPRSRRGKGEGEMGAACSLPPQEAARRLEVKNWRRRGGSTVAQPSVRAMARWRKGSGKAGDAEAA
jgi:hypothetical protein